MTAKSSITTNRTHTKPTRDLPPVHPVEIIQEDRSVRVVSSQPRKSTSLSVRTTHQSIAESTMKTILMIALLFITLLSPATALSASKESFKTVKIGSQTWMSENLNVATFRNGDKIQEVRSAAAWIKAYEDKKPAWCYYGFKVANGRKYGT